MCYELMIYSLHVHNIFFMYAVVLAFTNEAVTTYNRINMKTKLHEIQPTVINLSDVL